MPKFEKLIPKDTDRPIAGTCISDGSEGRPMREIVMRPPDRDEGKEYRALGPGNAALTGVATAALIRLRNLPRKYQLEEDHAKALFQRFGLSAFDLDILMAASERASMNQHDYYRS